ncbi:MAG: hypothetical protein ACRC8S_09590 [Fimbriiglobus sp.]
MTKRTILFLLAIAFLASITGCHGRLFCRDRGTTYKESDCRD